MHLGRHNKNPVITTGATGMKNIDNLSYELYSSREFPPIEKTLSMLAEIGYKEVEGFPGVYDDVARLAAALESSGLAMTCGHFDINAMEKDLGACLDIASTLGLKSIYCPYLIPDERPSDAPGWTEVGSRLARLAEKVDEAGFGFGWHNHDFEFQPLGDGTIPIDHLLGASDLVTWEADFAWVIKGNADPMEYIRRYGNKITSVHIKDIAEDGMCEDEDGWADVGKGTVDWKALLEALREFPVKHYVVEHDKPSDDMRFAKNSASFLMSL